MAEIDPVSFRDFERMAHDRIADSYDAFFAPITANAAGPLLDAVRSRVGVKLLDVATGPGVVAAEAARRGARVTGIDISPRMIGLAARLNPGCTFLEADVGALPFEDASFDAVVCAFGVGHFPSAEAALAECARVLAPGAWLAVAWWDTPARNRLQGVMLEAIQEVGALPPPTLPAGPPLFQYSEDTALRRLLGNAGLVEVTVNTHPFVHRVAGTQALWDGSLGSLARTSALVQSQPPDAKRRIREAFERGAGRYVGDDGISLPMSFKVAAGRKPFASEGDEAGRSYG